MVSLSLSVAETSREQISLQTISLGESLLLTADYTNALHQLVDSLNSWESIKSSFGLSWALYDLSILYLLTSEYTKAYSFSVKLFELSKDKIPARHTIKILFQLFVLALEQNDLSSVDTHFDQILKFCKKIEEREANAAHSSEHRR